MPEPRRSVSVFGATGSIGRNTLELLHYQGGAENYDVVALSGAGNVDLLAQQARKARARLAVTARPECYRALKDNLAGTGIEVAAGTEALAEAASRPVDWAMSAIVGVAGLVPTLQRCAMVALSRWPTRKAWSAAGELVRAECARAGTRLIPTDSEHSAIFQALQGQEADRHHPDGPRRSVPRLEPRADGDRDAGDGQGPSELGDGRPRSRSTAPACSTRRWR